MSIKTVQSGNYSVLKNNLIFTEGQASETLNILLKGKVSVLISPFERTDKINETLIKNKSFKLFSLESNTFLGSSDLFLSGRYSFSYKGMEDCIVYSFPAANKEQIKSILSTQKDYSAYIVNSITLLLENSYSALGKLSAAAKSLSTLSDNLIMFYWSLKEQLGFPHSTSGRALRRGLDFLEKSRDKNFNIPQEFSVPFFETDHSDVFETDYLKNYEINNAKFEYYVNFAGLPADLRKAYLGTNSYITEYHCVECSELLEDIQSHIKDALRTLESLVMELCSIEKESILNIYIKAANELKRSNSNPAAVLKVVELIIQKTRDLCSYFSREFDYNYEIDFEKIDSMIDKISASNGLSLEIDSLSQIGSCEDSIPEELQNSTERILEYSGIPYDRAELFLSTLEAFRSLKDRLSIDTSVRDIRKSASSIFFEVYEGVLKRVIKENNNSRLFHMFLNFAYADENLLCRENLINLYKLVDMPASTGLCPVHTMSSWLNSIYCMTKDPSINEFNQDYFDIFREMKKHKDLGEKEKIKYENDKDGRLNYEIFNMFKTNQRLCHGQISVYFPILHDEMITRDLSKAIVTADKINESVKRILDVDFSAFHREISYRNTEKGIEKELIMKAVTPDFILMPIFGSRALMWQELTGRNRTSPGRFILPVFTDENIDDLVMKLIGNFRWELCRTMMGVSWNDITQKSLTSEYMDYIQFYRKNRELSDDAKERIKSQLQKHRNMAREVFTSDYETWINHESKGILRHNKAVRNILYRHCPFSREIRDTLEKQPVFSDMSLQFKNMRSKHARELESRYAKLVKSGIALDPELEENLRFYKEQ